MKEDIKRNYDLQYEELMTVTKGLDKVAERADNYYEKKAKRTPWVEQYLRLTGKEEKK
jgi:fructose-bisphosphate aldolase class 1